MNQNFPPAKTTPPPAPALSSESVPQSRSTPASLHTAPPRASPLQTRDAPASAQSPSDSSKPAPAPAPEIPPPSRTAYRHSKTALPSQSSSQSPHRAYSKTRRKQSAT